MSLNVSETGTAAQVELSRPVCIFLQASRDAWTEVESVMTDDADEQAARITANIDRNLARYGYDPESCEAMEYCVSYREAIEEALAMEADQQEEAFEFAEMMANVPDSTSSPEWDAAYDASYDACYQVHCEGHGHRHHQNADRHMRRRNPNGDEDYARRYRMAYNQAYEGQLATWRAYSASQKQKKNH